MIYDYLIVGAGFFGSVFAHEAKKKNKKCLVIDKRSHIAGNCYTENSLNINVHKYGPHLFHTSSKKIWDYIRQFSDFHRINYKPKVFYKGKIYSFPINLFTLYQIYGVSNPKEAIETLQSAKIPCESPKNLEDWILSQVGKELYEIFIKGYTTKQWNKSPKELPSSIIKRIPIRTNFNDNYFDDNYQGVPIGGYTQIFEKLLDGINVRLNVDYFSDKENLDKLAKKVLYTGPIDKFFNCEFGELDYRSLRFEFETHELNDYQGTSCMNYTDLEVPYTRIVEHKHFENSKSDFTIITKEYPSNFGDPYYPINDEINNQKFLKYKELANKQSKYIFGGRLAEYRYYDMHQVIGSALNLAEKELD
jgi:UDP-galactopyranose mutase